VGTLGPPVDLVLLLSVVARDITETLPTFANHVQGIHTKLRVVQAASQNAWHAQLAATRLLLMVEALSTVANVAQDISQQQAHQLHWYAHRV
jgi:hypothetical protein